jgi:lipid-binding SYLF domain-containing protein
MNDRGMHSMLHSKVKLGGDASIAAGPKGRTASAESDVTLRAEMLSYSRSRGAFAGVSLEGSTLRPDGGANEKLYGKGVTAAEIVEEGKREVPAEGRELVDRLQQASPHLQK